MNFLAELRRRNVIRMAGLYLVGAWLVVQVAETVLPAFDIPGWVLRAIVLLLAIGFVPSLVFSWIFELTPEGLKRDHQVTPEESITAQTGRRMDRLLLVGMALVVVVIAADRIWPKADAPAPDAVPVGSGLLSDAGETAQADIAHPESEPDPVSSKSIAVLAFSDLSPERDQEYFSDGMAEEILNALSKVKDLKVAGRTSSFHFKGRNEDLRTIGETLGVAHILEGSVRKQGDRVRITAQLIQASNGFHLWSETYDGDMGDVFELQERIARAITDELKAVLRDGQAQRLVQASTSDPEAYRLFLQAASIVNRREIARFPEALAQLQEAVRLDPAFARAHARMASLHFLTINYNAQDMDRARAAVNSAARRALDLDPRLAEPHAALAVLHAYEHRYDEARKEFDLALAIDPDDTVSNFWLATLLTAAGYLRESTERLDRVLALDPLYPNAMLWRCYGHERDGDLDMAKKLCDQAMDAGLTHAGLGVALIMYARGDTQQATGYMARGMAPFLGGYPTGSGEVIARGMFGDAQDRQAALALIDRQLALGHADAPGITVYALAWMGQPERALELAGDGPINASLMTYLWSPDGHEARQSPAFLEYARRIGLTAYWDGRSAPDLCPRDEAGDYVCE